jgi:hypothetical protein
MDAVVAEGTATAEEFLIAAIEAIESKIRLIGRVAAEARHKRNLALAASLDHDREELEKRIVSIRNVLARLTS